MLKKLSKNDLKSIRTRIVYLAKVVREEPESESDDGVDDKEVNEKVNRVDDGEVNRIDDKVDNEKVNKVNK